MFYKHFKEKSCFKFYIKIFEVLHTEESIKHVVYMHFPTFKLFCRPRYMFYGNVNKPNYTGPRFIKMFNKKKKKGN